MKTLVLVFHPHLEVSRVNRKLMDAAERTANVTVVDEYAAYPHFDIDVEREHELIEAHDRIVLQFPFYWYSAPALLKQWQDDVLTAGWAYGGGRALEGKEFMVAVSSGSPADSYTHEGSHACTMEELLSPYETTFRHVNATYLQPFMVQGVSSLSDEQLDQAAAQYSAALTA